MIVCNEKRIRPLVIDTELFKENVPANNIIQEALEASNHVVIPELDFPVLLDRPIVLSSGKRLSVDTNTVLHLAEGTGGCFVRNKNLVDGTLHEAVIEEPDSNIIIEGGIWEGGKRGCSVNDDNPVMHNMGGALLGVIFFENCRNFKIRNITVRHCEFDGILINLCENFIIEDIFFDDHYKDGVHVNGPAYNGTIRRMHGKAGDDFVALNAWDWEGSAVSYGPIENIVVEDITCDGGEIRLLPGRKTYKDGSKTECPINNTSFNRIKGIYTIKLYQQPNCFNDLTGANDKSEIPGDICNATFDDVSFEGLSVEGFGEIEVNALFEICADCKGLSIRNIKVALDREDFIRNGLLLSRVGTKSSTWKHGSSNPNEWCELFDTDLICTADNVHFSNITFNGIGCTDKDTLIGATKLEPNPDYPNTTPKGGTGYGIIGTVTID